MITVRIPCRILLLITMGFYLSSPYSYSFKQMSGGCACGCGESVYCNYCLEDLDQDGSVLAFSKCRCCSSSENRKISAKCNCHSSEEQPNSKSLEIIISGLRIIGLPQEAGNSLDFDDGLPLPGYRIPPMKPPPRPQNVLES